MSRAHLTSLCCLLLMGVGSGCGALPSEDSAVEDPAALWDAGTPLDEALEDVGAEPPPGEEPVPPEEDAGTEPPQGEEPVPPEEDAGTEPSPTEPPVEGPLCAAEDDAPSLPSPLPNVNHDPAFVHVYVSNVENLKKPNEQCAGDWTDLIHYMKTVKPSPDLFLVQQISHQAQLDFLVERMSNALPGVYAGIIADADPWPQASPCGPEKAQQTNAIIYRVGRFEPVGDKHVWQSWAFRNGQCRRNHQARTRNVMQKLRDKVNDAIVTVASLHWSTAQGTGADPACAERNVREADQKLHRADFGGDLLLFGGDMNEPDRFSGGAFRPWHRAANGDRDGELGYRDVVYRMCEEGSASLQQCLDENWTVPSGRRIDYLFAQDGEGCLPRTRRTHTITFNEADAAAAQLTGSDSPLNYSDHRAIRSLIFY